MTTRLVRQRVVLSYSYQNALDLYSYYTTTKLKDIPVERKVHAFCNPLSFV
jgi:hypothetical protein